MLARNPNHMVSYQHRPRELERCQISQSMCSPRRPHQHHVEPRKMQYPPIFRRTLASGQAFTVDSPAVAPLLQLAQPSRAQI